MTASPHRVAAAQISHETNVFSAVRTDRSAFEQAGLRFGADILAAETGTNSAFGGFVVGAAKERFDLIPLVSVWATPSGIVTADAIDELTDILLTGLRDALAGGPLAGVLLALHGAMVTERDEDGDAFLLEAVRRTVGRAVPIVAALDLHANISPRMVDAADLLVGYRTYPHVDMADRATEACASLASLVGGAVRPTPYLVKPPMLPTSQRMTTDREPMRGLMARAARAMRDPRVLNVTVAGGFPASDVPDAGLSVLVTTDGDRSLARELATGLAQRAWDERDGFLGGVSTFAEAAAMLRDLPAVPARPLLLVDIGDNPWTGGPGDSAELVRFLIKERVTGAAVALVADPETVQQSIEAGVGATIDVRLGGKTDRIHGEPLAVRATIRLISTGQYVNDGPMMAGLTVDLGPSVVLDCADAGLRVLVTTRAETPIDLNVFRAHSIDPTALRVIGLKGKGHFRAAFAPIASAVVLVEGPGITGVDLSRLPFRRIRRPIWPLDETTFAPESVAVAED